jgi:SAM-dependent methyltransferase
MIMFLANYWAPGTKAFNISMAGPTRKSQVGVGQAPPGVLPAQNRLRGHRHLRSLIAQLQKAAEINSGSRFELSDGRRPTGVSDDHFDMVMAAYVITTVQDPYQVCREILRVVKPGGKIIAVNHTRSQNGSLWGRFEDLMAPVFVRIGFTTDLDVIRVMNEVGITVQQAVRCNLLNTGRIIMGTKHWGVER